MPDAANLTDVAQKLRSLQSHYGLTLQEMADRCALPKRSLENYMRLKKPQRPGLDALRSIADGLKVSIDWLLGRIDERFAPEFTTEDYALFCHSVVLRLLDEVVTNAAKNPEAFDADKLTINDVAISDISAAAILDFIHVVEKQKGNPNRPSGYGVEQFKSIAGSAIAKGRPQHVEEILGRKL